MPPPGLPSSQDEDALPSDLRSRGVALSLFEKSLQPGAPECHASFPLGQQLELACCC